ncbi:hypothetical protein ACFLQN_04975 [Candidatus Aenigmatarchaeota archaeon]
MDNKKFGATIIVFIVIAFIVNSFYIEPSISIARGQGTVLSPNWWEGLNWIKENTDECAVVATYWDPGHFITGIARRPVVFDGASQSELYKRTIPNTDFSENELSEGLHIIPYDSGINHIILVEGDKKTTARIQDISTTLLTGNETLAVNILKEFRQPGCNEMYYIASADLIGKSVWWSYFATWNPETKGSQYSYALSYLSKATPLPAQNSVVYTYPLDAQTSFVVFDTNSTLTAKLQQQNQFLDIEHFFYFNEVGQGKLLTNTEAPVKGTAWLAGDRQTLVFMPPELESSLFTRMFFYNGQGLERFQYVNNWGGELKLYKVIFDDIEEEPPQESIITEDLIGDDEITTLEDMLEE